MTSFLRSMGDFMRGFGSFRRPKSEVAVVTGGPPAASGQHPRPRTRGDREFLPAALEILESPPSPIHMALMSIICVFVAVAVTWSWIGRVDIVAVAGGKIQPQGRVKTIQSVETGRVDRLEVSNGSSVAAGDVLFTLDPADAQVDTVESETNLAAFRAEALRRAAAIESVRTGGQAPINWPDGIPAAQRERQTGILASDLKQLQSTIVNLKAQLNQKRAERERLEETITAQSALVATLKERVDMRSALVATGSGAKSAVLDARESYETQAANVAYQKGQRVENEAAIVVAESEIDKALDGFVADNNQKRENAEREADDDAQKLEHARIKSLHMVVRSPIGGIVQGSTITTIGQVVNTGEELMRIVPGGTRLEVEAYLQNKDIGFVHEGQEAVVKVESFPFTRYGTLTGKITRVASDAIPETDAEVAQAAPARSARDNSIGGGQRTRDLVFPITIELDDGSIEADGRRIPLMPGMAVTAEIRTGTRRMLDYLLSPIKEVSSTAIKER